MTTPNESAPGPRVLHVINYLRAGGAERLVVDLAVGMRRAGVAADVLALQQERAPLSAELRRAGVPYATLTRRMSNYDPRHAWRLARVMRGYDVVHVHLFPSQYWAALARHLGGFRGVLVTTEHNTWNARCRYALTSWLDRRAYSAYDCIIGVSAATTDFMRRRTRGLRRVVTIENGIDLERVCSMRADRRDVMPELPPDAFVMVQVARFEAQKDQDSVLRALRQLPERVHAVFVGEGPRRPLCERLARELGVAGRAHFLGFRPDAPRYVSAADVAVMASHWESFGLAAVEAMALGVPVVAARVEGLAQVVDQPDLLFEAGNAAALSKKVLPLCDDSKRRQHLAALCRQRASAFGIDKTVKAHLALYQDEMERHGKEA